MNAIFRFALSLANMPDQAVADLEKNLPVLARLCQAAKKLDPLIRQAKPHLDPLKPIAEQALDVVEAAWPDFVAVLPTIEEFIEFVNAKGDK